MVRDLEQHRAWETIADSFHASRNRTWGHVESWLEALPREARVLDLMAGNGRHTAVAARLGLDVTASDWSRPLCRINRTHSGADAVASDARQLPFVDGAFDACVFTAGLHGIPEAQGRADCLREVARVTKPGGQVQITVWSRLAPRFRDQGDSRASLDVIIPWRSGGHDVDRTYHLYTAEDLAHALRDAGFQDVQVQPVAAVGTEADNLVATAISPH